MNKRTFPYIYIVLLFPEIRRKFKLLELKITLLCLASPTAKTDILQPSISFKLKKKIKTRV